MGGFAPKFVDEIRLINTNMEDITYLLSKHIINRNDINPLLSVTFNGCFTNFST